LLYRFFFIDLSFLLERSYDFRWYEFKASGHGARVEQGRSDLMTKGDWLLVPSGTPHWHTEYPKPFGFYRYLLVKVDESDSIGTLP
jgi:hypothetical protein